MAFFYLICTVQCIEKISHPSWWSIYLVAWNLIGFLVWLKVIILLKFSKWLKLLFSFNSLFKTANWKWMHAHCMYSVFDLKLQPFPLLRTKGYLQAKDSMKTKEISTQVWNKVVKTSQQSTELHYVNTMPPPQTWKEQVYQNLWIKLGVYQRHIQKANDNHDAAKIFHRDGRIRLWNQQELGNLSRVKDGSS